jgi:hypothetical protein
MEPVFTPPAEAAMVTGPAPFAPPEVLMLPSATVVPYAVNWPPPVLTFPPPADDVIAPTPDAP